MVTFTPKLGLRNPDDPDDANDAVRVWRTADNTILDDAVLGANLGTLVPTVLPSQQLLVNPGMEVWQRGVGPFSANLAYTADRWRISLAGSSTLQVSRDSTNADAGSQYCAACTYAHNTASNIQQLLEGYLELRGRTLTFSARVRTATASAVRIALYDSVNLQRYSAYHSGSGAYETLTVTAPIAAATTTVLAMVSFAASCTAYVDSTVLVVGTSAPPYAPLHPADEMSRCQRYYEVHGGVVNSVDWNLYSTGAGVTSNVTMPIARKAVTPTVTRNGTWALSNASAQPTAANPSMSSYRMYCPATAAGMVEYSPDSADDTVTIEGNP
jgi:hypothetical protein